MIDISKLKKKERKDEYIGARVSEELKSTLDQFCKDEGINVNSLLTALVTEFLASKGYLKKSE